MSPRQLLLAGVVLTAVGLALAMISPHAGMEGYGHARVQQLLGGLVLLFGWVILGWGIHRFGRSADS